MDKQQHLISKNHRVSHNSVWTNPIHFFAFGFGSGVIPIMPGTFGTLAAIPLYLVLAQLSWPYYGLITLILLVVGIYWCNVTARDLGVHDYPGIVWDEIVGYLVTMFAVPLKWSWIILGFVLFRLFDIWKPWPIKWLDNHVQGGFGIMIDDIVAAIYAWLVLQVVVWMWV